VAGATRGRARAAGRGRARAAERTRARAGAAATVWKFGSLPASTLLLARGLSENGDAGERKEKQL
jgi:hypothetical protein